MSAVSWVYVLIWSVFSALCTGLGALPLLFIAPNDRKWIARCNAITSSTKERAKQTKSEMKKDKEKTQHICHCDFLFFFFFFS